VRLASEKDRALLTTIAKFERKNDKNKKTRGRMVQKYFIESWLLPCSLRSHRTANSSPKNGLRHFSALPTHHPTSGGRRSGTIQ